MMGGNTPKNQTTTTTGATTGTTAGTETGQTSGTTLANQLGYTSGQTSGQNFAQQTANLPSWLQPFVTQATQTAGSSLADLQRQTGTYSLPPEVMQALGPTAAGDFLYGGQGQQPFIDAAVRAASPGIFSAFGAAGRAGSGLEQNALDQSAIDAYARLYQGERTNQLNAAQAIPGISMLPLDLQRQLTSLAGGLPGQFAPFLGQTSLGLTGGSQTGLTGGTTSGMTTGQTTGTTTGQTSGTTSGTQTQPIYQPPWWQTALGGLGLVGGGLLGLNPASGIGKTVSQVPYVGGLVGAAR